MDIMLCSFEVKGTDSTARYTCSQGSPYFKIKPLPKIGTINYLAADVAW